MLKITQVKLPVEHSEKDIRNKLIKELRLNNLFAGDYPYFSYNIIRRSIDARKKPDIFFVYSVSVDFNNERIEDTILKRCKNRDVSIYEKNKYVVPKPGNACLKYRPIIVGSGPAGLFAALILSENGYSPIIIERGEKVEKRVEKINKS